MTAKRMAFVAAIAVFLGAAAPVSAQDIKIGVVDWTRLLVESPQMEQVQENMQGQFASRMEDLQEKREQLESDGDRLQRDGSVMSRDARSKLEDSIRSQQRQLRLIEEELSEDVQRVRQEEMQALQQQVRQVITEYADAEGYDLIIGDGFLHAADGINLTDEVLALLKDDS